MKNSSRPVSAQGSEPSASVPWRHARPTTIRPCEQCGTKENVYDVGDADICINCMRRDEEENQRICGSESGVSTGEVDRFYCVFCDLRIYQDKNDVLFPNSWRHHGSNAITSEYPDRHRATPKEQSGEVAKLAAKDAEIAKLKAERASIVSTLKAACHRSWEDESPEVVATIASNAIHWRNLEISVKEQTIETLERWKREAIEVLNRWDVVMEYVGAHGGRLGHNASDEALRILREQEQTIAEQKKRIAELEAK